MRPRVKASPRRKGEPAFRRYRRPRARGQLPLSLSGRLIMRWRTSAWRWKPSGRPFPVDASPLSKTSAVLDTLSVIAVGFERGERMVEP